MLFHLKTLGFSHSRHCRMSEASLQAFRSLIAKNLHRVSESSEVLSLRWVRECFRMLPVFNNGFAKLMVEIGYPVSKWESDSIEEYFDYSIHMLELLNSIASSLSHVNHHRVSLAHALRIMETERLREIKHSSDSIKELKRNGGDGGHGNGIGNGNGVRNGNGIGNGNRNGIGNGNGKGRIFHEAILILKASGLWVCRIVLSGLKSDCRSIMEVMADSSVVGLDSIFGNKVTEEGELVMELERVNESVRLITSNGIGIDDSGAAKELEGRLEVLGNELKGLKEGEEGLFAEIMAVRNEVLETLRRNNN